MTRQGSQDRSDLEQVCRFCARYTVGDCWETRAGKCSAYETAVGITAAVICAHYRRGAGPRATCPFYAVECTKRNVELCILASGDNSKETAKPEPQRSQRPQRRTKHSQEALF